MSELNSTFTLDDIAKVMGKHKSTVIRQANKEGWNYTERPSAGKPLREFALFDLPQELQTKLVLQAAQAEADVLYGPQLAALSAELQTSVDAFHAEQPIKPIHIVDWDHFRRKTAKQQQKAYREADVVLQLKRMIDAERQRVFALRQAQGERNKERRAENSPLRVKKKTVVDMMKEVAAANPAVCKSWRTLRNWWLGKSPKIGCVHFDEKDYAPALSGSYRGRVALAECTPAAWEYYVSLYLHRSQPSFKDGYRRTVAKAAESEWVVPGEATLRRRLLAEYSIEAITILREGEEAWRRLRPFIVRDKSSLRAGEAVSGDGLKFDRLWTEWPDGDVINTSTAWFWQDLHSGKIVAWRLGKTESTDLFRLATFDLTGHFLPTYMQVDNTRVAANKQMTAGVLGRNRFGNQPNDFMGMLPMLGIDAHFTTPDHTIGSPGSKPIERAFGIGGIHEKVATNPKIRDRGFSKATAISSDELREIIAYEVIRHNAQEKRMSPVCGGVLSFDQAYEKSFVSWAPRKASEAQRRILLLCIEGAKASSSNGQVTIKAGRSRLGSNKYWCEGLNEYRGQEVAVFYDPDDLTKDVDIYNLEGRFLMTAQHQASTAFLDKEAGAELMKRTQRQKKLLKKQLVEDAAINKLHDEKLPGLVEPETPVSKVVTGLFNKPLEQGFEGDGGQVIDADAVFSKAIAMMGG